MQQSKLVQFLALFTADEMKRFDRFLSSPYFNASHKLLEFFDCIAKYHPVFDSPKLNKEKIYAALHGKSSRYNDTTMRELIADLLKLARTFTAHEQLQKDGPELANQRYLWVTDKNSEKMREEEIESASKLLEKQQERNIDYYRHRWLHDLHLFELTSARLSGAEHKFFNGFDFTRHIHSMNRYHLVCIFEVNIYMQAFTKIYNQPMDGTLVEHIDALAKNYINRGDPAIDMYYHSYQLYSTGEEKYFDELKADFILGDPIVPRIVRIEAAIALENYCIKKIRLGDDRFGEEIIGIYKFEVEQGLCVENGKINYTFYQNVAGMGAESRLLDWVEVFVEEYRGYLPDEYKEEAYRYSRAHILFARKKYLEALRLALSAHNSHFFWNKILIRNLVVRIQYELGMFRELQLELDAYKHHLADEKVSEIWRKNMQLYVNSLRSLIELNFDPTTEKIKKLKNKFASEKQLTSRQWFVNKVTELENRRKRK